MSAMRPSDLINAFNTGRSFVKDKEDKVREDEKWKFEKDKLSADQEKRDYTRGANKALKDFFTQDYSVPQLGNAVVAQGTNSAVSQDGAVKPVINNPMANGTSVGGAPAQQPQFKMPDIETAQQRIFQAQKLAAQYPEFGERLSKYSSTLKGASLSQYAKSFNGDPTQDPVGYTKYMAKGSAILGDYMTPEQARSQATYFKKMEKEGVADALRFIKAGDLKAANKKWNGSGAMRGTITNVKDIAVDMYGVKKAAKQFDLIDADGKVIGSYNTANLEQMYEDAKAVTEMQQKGVKLKADVANIDADNKREDLKVDLSAKNGKGGNRGKNGLTPSENLSSIKYSVDIFQQNIGVSTDNPLEDEYVDIHSYAVDYIGALNKEGFTSTQSQKFATGIYKKAKEFRDNGMDSKDAFGNAVRYMSIKNKAPSSDNKKPTEKTDIKSEKKPEKKKQIIVKNKSNENPATAGVTIPIGAKTEPAVKEEKKAIGNSIINKTIKGKNKGDWSKEQKKLEIELKSSSGRKRRQLNSRMKKINQYIKNLSNN